MESEDSVDADSDTEEPLTAMQPSRTPKTRPQTKASTMSSFRPSTTRSGVSGKDKSESQEEAQLPMKVLAAPK